MNGIQNVKTHNPEKPFPACLGRMANPFDLSTTVAGNRLLTDKPHLDGSPHSRVRSNAGRMSPSGDSGEDKMSSRSASNKKLNGTPMKTLIAQEMLKEVEFKHNSPGVVAKLMGLEVFPRHQAVSAARRNHSRGYPHNHSGISYREDKQGLNLQIQCEIHKRPEQNEYKDVYEIWQQSQKGIYVRDKSSQKGWHNDSLNERNMALVRQKFIEAKHLATDEKLRQSGEFQDALEILSSNRDLFLKCLQERNSLFSQHLYDLASVPASPETKRITILRPSKMVDDNKFSGYEKKDQKQVKKSSHMIHVIGWDKRTARFSPARWPVNDGPAKPTQIVVLKPNLGKPHDIKPMASSPFSSPIGLQSEKYYEELEDNKARESRDAETTQHMCQSSSAYQEDGTLPSVSNAYTGNGSSFNKSEDEYALGNQSGPEIISPTSRHSWDYINRFGSPYSSSFFGNVSYSLESSVCREAKKRLSERWALMTSSGHCLEQRHVHRSSSTLGEMLALSDTKNSVRSVGDSIIKEQEPRGSIPSLSADLNKDGNLNNSPQNLLRSKSLSVSSTVFEGNINVEVSVPEVGRKDISKEAAKVQNAKTSFKWKVSSLFFSRTKKSSEERSNSPLSGGAYKKTHDSQTSSLREISDCTLQHASDGRIEESSFPASQGPLSKLALPDSRPEHGVVSAESGPPVSKCLVSRSSNENQDQPSPISVLEPPFDEDDNVTAQCWNVKPDRHGPKLPAHCVMSNLIDKSPPIGSVARTLSRDSTCLGRSILEPLVSPCISEQNKEEDPDWPFFVQALLSAAGLDGEVKTDSYFVKWHSAESPLNPSLRDEYIDFDNKEIIYPAKQKKRRSTRKLVFDCVNAALVDITGHGSETSLKDIRRCGGIHDRLLVDEVWARMKEWFSSDVMRCGDGNGLVVEMVVKREVVGMGWMEHVEFERNCMGKEIGGMLLEELVQEAVVEFMGR
ncbi:hypothetical protein NMG60_11034586 [Bertholletia excelsa]